MLDEDGASIAAARTDRTVGLGGPWSWVIGRAVGCTTGTASKWRVRYAEKRFGGLDETGDRGAEPKYTAETGKRILALLDQPKPKGYARWSGPLLAAALGDVDVQYIWRFLRAQKIDLAGRKSWCESNDPEFAAKAADVVGLYMAPPENAIVIASMKSPRSGAGAGTGHLKMPNGRALGGHSHDYKRNGTSTLFAAFEVATGKVTAAHKKRRRRIEFLDFMNDIVAACRHCHPRRARQPQYPQTQKRPLAKAASEPSTSPTRLISIMIFLILHIPCTSFTSQTLDTTLHIHNEGLPDRRFTRPADRIQRRARPCLASAAFDLQPAVTAVQALA